MTMLSPTFLVFLCLLFLLSLAFRVLNSIFKFTDKTFPHKFLYDSSLIEYCTY